MKYLKDFMVESMMPSEGLPKHVHISSNLANDGFSGVIAMIKQKTAKQDQMIFAADSFDDGEFGKDLPVNEVLVRVSTPLSNKRNTEHRVIARINASTGKLRWINNEVYEDSGKVKWERPLKLDFLTIDERSISYFKIW